MIIYCLNLELNRIFLYVCSQNNKSDEYILLEAEIYYNYLQKYKPISIIKKIETTIDNDNDNDKLLDIYVKENMICGINTVHEEHCCFQDLTLFKLDKIRHCKNTNNEYVENLITKYLCKNRTIEEILFEKQELENSLEKYKKEKQELENISIDGSQIIENIRWIKEICSRNKNINKNENENKFINKKENINRYRNILFLLNQVYTILTSTSTFSTYSKNISDIYIKYPKFLLDDFFCHWHRTHLEEYMKEVEIFCSIYEEMTNVIIQKMKEIELNIKTYDNDFEWKISRALYMLNKEYTNLILQ